MFLSDSGTPIKDRTHIEQNFHSVAGACPRGGTWGCWWVKNFSMGICDGEPSSAGSSCNVKMTSPCSILGYTGFSGSLFHVFMPPKVWKDFPAEILCVQFSFCFFKLAIYFRKICHCSM